MLSDMVRFPENVARAITNAIETAVGDDILEDIRKSNLSTHNSTPSRVWDYLNTNLRKNLSVTDCTVADAHRGPWEMHIVYDGVSQTIITFMREKRFSQLQKKQHRRDKMHYVDMLAKQFNSDLKADPQQVCMFEQPEHTFSDQNRLAELVQMLLSDLTSDISVVRHHILVLFETVGFDLVHVRAVMVTPALEIVKESEQNWSKYISSSESVVVEKVSNPNAPENQPNRGLTLKPKAVARKKNMPRRKTSLEERES